MMYLMLALLAGILLALVLTVSELTDLFRRSGARDEEDGGDAC